MQGCKEIHGVDVAKDEVVVAMHGHSPVRAIANEREAIDIWLATLPRGSIVAMESTGIYHRLLAQRAHAAGMQVYVLNARDVHFYAKALGARGKTDRVDAALIARYAAEHHAKLHTWQPGEGAHKRVQELLGGRATLVGKQESVRQAFKGDRDLAGRLKQLDESFKQVLAAIDAKVDELIAADCALATGRKRIASVIGFGPQGSALLAVLFARIPFANIDAVVAYSGTDPRPNDSGKKRGTRKLSKRGPAHLRRQIYLSGFSASHSKALKPLYQALWAKGFATTEAFVILGRKLLRVAFAVWKSGQPWDPAKLLPKSV
ncbi:MAG TPA: IS110 family transposase [Candidatus Sulfotelmatobacter sp.]|nr:IS110 family transposase [Candidatus Sulfotelmatobacter sp.]